MARERRSGEEVKKLAEQAKALVDGGKSATAAAAEVGISRSIYDRHIDGKTYKTSDTSRKKWRSNALGAKKKRKWRAQKTRERLAGSAGSIDVDSLPPRPKKGGKRVPKPLDLHDVAALATRIAKYDKQLRKFAVIRTDRLRLAKLLMDLLRKS